ncbi:MAG: methyltransferase regulatory domain-containing protein [Paracoccaceae bacterium]
MSQVDYETVPYRSVPYGATQPTHVGAVASLFGLSPAVPSTASVLELGCASGGNLIPLAVRYPDARFVGVDLSERHVGDGQATVHALGLGNIEIRQGDIAELTYPADAFDYIICHGVYSWVPPAAQDAILRIAAKSLCPDGVLYVSYNIYPGWHLRTIVRDICLYHAGETGAPELRVARARWALKQMAENASDVTPYGQLLRQEAALNAKMPDSYIMGEFLATHNAPCHFHEFIARAAAAGLAYLSETDLSASLPETMPSETAKLIRSIAGDSGMAVEQYMDFFAGRQFRRSILMRADQQGRTSRAIGAQKLADLHISTSFREEAPEKDGDPVPFAGIRGKIAVSDPGLLAILRYLGTAFPDTRTPAEIREHLIDLGNIPSDSSELDLLRALFSLVAAQKLEIYSEPQRVGRASDPHPEIWLLARYQAASGQEWVASQSHNVMRVNPGSARILAMLDGTRDRAALIETFSDALADGSLELSKERLPADMPRAQILQVAGHALDDMLAKVEQQALLRPNS